MKTKINLGSGTTKREGYINIDICPHFNVDVVRDIEKDGLTPYKPNTMEEVYIRHALEHFTMSGAIKVLQECHRVLIPGGRIIIVVPEIINVLTQFLEAEEKDRWSTPAKYIWGGQERLGQIHKSGYTKERLITILRRVGFHNFDFTEIKLKIGILCIRVIAQK